MAVTVESVWTFPRESRELVGPIVVSLDGTPTGAYQVAVLPRGARPVEGDWTAPDVVGPDSGVIVGPGSTRGQLEPGEHRVWVRVPGTAEQPVLDRVALVVIT